MRNRMAQLIAAIAMCLALISCSKKSTGPTAPPAPTSGSLFVRSIPSTARLQLDGVSVEVLTPKLFQNLSLSQHSIGMSMVGYADTTLTPTPTPGAIDTLNIALRPLAGTPRSFTTWKDLGEVTLSVAVGPTGKIYATSFYHFWVFSSTGDELTKVGLPFAEPAQSVAVNAAGQAYFGHDSYLYKFSETGTQLAKIGEPPGGVTRFDAEPQPAITRGDSVIVAVPQYDHGLSRYFNDAYAGDVWASVDSTLYAIACNPSDGTIVAVASDRNRLARSKRILKLAPNGQVLAQWGTAVNDAVAVGPDGSVYVAGSDAATFTADGAGAGRVQRFTSSGTLIAEWGVENASYLHDLFMIPGIGVDASGKVYLTNFNGHRIIQFVP